MSGIDLIKKIREKDQNYTKKIILISATIKGNILTDFIFHTIAFNISPQTGCYGFTINLFQMFKYSIPSE